MIYNNCMMEFKKNIKKQSQRDTHQTYPSFKEEDVDILWTTSRTMKKYEGREDIQNVKGDEKKTLHEIAADDFGQVSLKESITTLQGKIQNVLTVEERKIVEDLSKLFSNETSKPTKLFVRLNQTQSSKAKRQGELGAVSESRLQKIEVTRIGENEVESKCMDFKKFTEHMMENQSSAERGQQEDRGILALSRESQVRVFHSESANTNLGLKFTVSKQVSIVFVPDLNLSSLINMKNPPALYSKFNKKNEDMSSVKSHYSNEPIQEKPSQSNNLSETFNFVKLLQVQLFLRRKEIRLQRSQQLRQANQKLLASHLLSKQQLQKNHLFMKKSEQYYKNKFEQLNAQLEQQRKSKKELQGEIELKEKTIISLNKLNEQYLKENNELKNKIKDHIKNIHELKLEVIQRDQEKPTGKDTNYQESSNKVHNKNAVNHQPKKGQDVHLLSVNGQNEYGQSYIPKYTRRQVSFNAINQQQNTNFQFYNPNPYYTTEPDEKSIYQYARIDQKDRNDPKLVNSKSHQIFLRPQTIKNERIVNQQQQPTSRSQKTIGIRKNNPNKQSISPSTRNLVRVNKNSINDASILIGDPLRDNKSLSSYSNLSGKSLSQRIGYISKPVVSNQRQTGVLVDYMIEDSPTQKQQQRQRTSNKQLQRFKFKRDVHK